MNATQTRAKTNEIKNLTEAARTGDEWIRGYAIESIRLLTESSDWRVRQQAKLALAKLAK